MADMAQFSGRKMCRLLVVMICLVMPATGLKPKEESAFKDLLKAVEKNFEKLTTRITALENTVSSMQFYSIRQFNQISGSLQSTNNDLGTVRKQVSQIEIDGRSQKITLSLLGRDVSELKKSSSDLLSELESSMVYVHEHIDKQSSIIKTVLEDAMIKTERETTTQFSQKMEEMMQRIEATKMEPVNCTVDISGHIDLRFSEFKKQTQAHFVKLINAAKLDLKKSLSVKDLREDHTASRVRLAEHVCDCKTRHEKVTNAAEDLTAHYSAHDSDNWTENVTRHEDTTTQISNSEDTTSYINRFENKTTYVKGSGNTTQINKPNDKATRIRNPEDTATYINRPENTTTQISRNKDTTIHISRSEDITTHIPHHENKQFQDEEDEKVMNALYNMTNSVQQAVSYFRNTGRLLEQILSNTDSLVILEAGLNRRLGAEEIRDQVPSQYGENYPSNLIPGSEDEKRQQTYNDIFSGRQSAEGGVHVATVVSDNVATMIKNGSQLLEVLTDLAQLSSVSLAKATAALQDEVKRIEGIRTQMATTITSKATSEESDSATRLTNTTQKIFKLVEAIASQTGWIPQIFLHVHQLESLANHSLQIVKQNQEILSQVQQTVTTQNSAKNTDHDENDPILSNRIPHTLGQVEGPPYRDLNTSSKIDAFLNKESLETIYSTSLQLNRIMPALTKLLAESDPLLTLVGGGRPDQGRVEIYYRGLWGALCHDDLSHLEADLICRHLGFKGGISAGRGHFGPGTGVPWIFNASCLGSNLCSVVEHSEESEHCSHDLDAAVVCDHMLRIVSSNGLTSGRAGRLEIHHRSSWLPVCGDGWTDFSARVACQQMGFSNGTQLGVEQWAWSTNSTWLGKTTCAGLETRLDACPSNGWTDSCTQQIPAGVSCV